MGIFGKNKQEKLAEYESQRVKEESDFAARAIEFPEMEVRCEVWWDGGWYERGSRKNNEDFEFNIHIVLNKSKNTERDEKSRRTTEIGYLVPKSPSDVNVVVFEKVVNKLNSKSAKRVFDLIKSPTPVKVHLSHCYEDEDRGLPDRYDTTIDLRTKNYRKRQSTPSKATPKKTKSVDQISEDLKNFGSNQEVVGLDYRQSTLDTIVGPDNQGSLLLKATLLREPKNPFDKNAVQVNVKGEVVGYIPRTDNLKYHEILAKHEKVGNAYICDAMICWETVADLKRFRMGLKIDPK
jgi:hypothetical protein